MRPAGRVAADSEEYAACMHVTVCKFIRRSFTGKADREGAWPHRQLINATWLGLRLCELTSSVYGPYHQEAFNIREVGLDMMSYHGAGKMKTSRRARALDDVTRKELDT